MKTPDNDNFNDTADFILFLVTILALFMLFGCKKEYIEPVAIPVEEKPYFLDFSGAGVNCDSLKQVSCNDLYSGYTDIGDLPRFEKGAFMVQFAIQGDSLPDFATGMIGTKTFLLYCKSGYMNICDSLQHVPVTFKVYR